MSYWPQEDKDRAPVNDFPPAWASSWGDDRYGLWADLVVGGVAQRMRWIEPTMGDGFWMGAPQTERDAIQDRDVRKWANEHESLPHLVHIKQGFWMADTPCTQHFWQAVTGDKPYHFKEDADRYPAGGISQQGALEFCKKLDYSLSRPGIASLPTEAQWEYACRADSITAYWWADQFDPAMANAKDRFWSWETKPDEDDGVTPVMSYPPNPWGLYDMHGNVTEWCDGEWAQKIAPKKNSENIVFIKGEAPVRGGMCRHHPARARAAFRQNLSAHATVTSIGFRFVLKSKDY
jgi:formylglycine-generating enzyme required for sulfatase activity